MDRRISFLIDRLQANLNNGWTISQMAMAVDMSISHFQRIFRLETGLTAHQYLRRARLEKARELLECTPLSVKEVRTRVGVEDNSHFSRDFRKKYGMSPTEYRALEVSKRAKIGVSDGK